jgi:colicin import membrane protein
MSPLPLSTACPGRAQECKKAQDKYDEEVRQQEKKNQEKQETIEKSWQLRETALKEREDEVARLRGESEARLQQEILVMKKDAEAEKRFCELRVKTFEETVAHQQAQIAALEKQLADAKQHVQDIAVRAIEGASGAKALSHINQIAMEQAKNRPQG